MSVVLLPFDSNFPSSVFPHSLSAGEQGWEHLFRVQDTNLQARVALQVLDQWPLGACRELLEFCLSKSNMDASLEDQLQKKKQEMDMYHNVSPPKVMSKVTKYK